MATTLSLGVGLSAGIFSFADGYLFRRLPFPGADQLYRLRDPNAPVALLASEAVALRESEIAEFGFVQWNVNSLAELVVGDRSTEAWIYEVDPGFRRRVALPLAAGRDFRLEEHRPGGPLAAWLSYRFWQREFGGSRDVIGRSFSVRGPISPARRLRAGRSDHV